MVEWEEWDVAAVPDEEKIEKRAGKISKEFSDLVFPEGYQPGAGKRKVRRRPFCIICIYVSSFFLKTFFQSLVRYAF